ncbi:Concanavalin A-like lectins/glucanase [Glarea lozoyensis ATCC 20868]|uniref:Concanavalin A-like lectins/glucanase n=1 Tax=Glarea lozoyensis (strain ATCC 20868 / MF5171) TaxID=1116229 RepID=S3DDP2_GLAL2|nr:Concanavalin A-like lectins/glucanase [Glarea lozoyensis ATCC 20868]EPE24763.1 Concanavalin A-like lectins/glucanase [Glarea lozoyensis ATCC 20868]
MKASTLFAYLLFSSVAFTAPRLGHVLTQRGIAEFTRDAVSVNDVSRKSSAGAFIKARDSITFTSLAAKIVVPTVIPRGEGGIGIYVGLQNSVSEHFVGIKINIEINPDDTVSFSAWCQWSPQVVVEVPATELPFGSSDTISVNVAILSGGKSVLCRLAVPKKGAGTSREVSSSGQSFNPIEWDATWSVRPLEQHPKLAYFDTVSFSDASVIHDNDPIIYTVAGAEATSLTTTSGVVDAIESFDEISSSVTVARLF